MTVTQMTLSRGFREIIRLGGLETESEYPYDGEKEPSCKLERSELAAYINSSLQLPKDEQKMALYLSQHGPISIGEWGGEKAHNSGGGN